MFVLGELRRLEHHCRAAGMKVPLQTVLAGKDELPLSDGPQIRWLNPACQFLAELPDLPPVDPRLWRKTMLWQLISFVLVVLVTRIGLWYQEEDFRRLMENITAAPRARPTSAGRLKDDQLHPGVQRCSTPSNPNWKVRASYTALPGRAENMLRNLQEMRSYRQGIDEVVERRKAAARQFMEEFKPNPDTIKLSELKPAPHLDPLQPRPKENQSMKVRISAMEVNAESNNEALGDHRKVLDCILAIRQAAAERAMDPSKVSPSQALAAAANQVPDEASQPEPVSINQKCSAMQKAAVSKARSDDVKEKRAWQEAEQREEDVTTATEIPPLRPHSVFETAHFGGLHNVGFSAWIAPGVSDVPRRPGRCPALRRPVQIEETLIPGTSGRSSRPSSVSSLTARFRNLQECVEKNQETLQSHRHGLEMERVQRLADELLQSVKNMYEQREAERNGSQVMQTAFQSTATAARSAMAAGAQASEMLQYLMASGYSFDQAIQMLNVQADQAMQTTGATLAQRFTFPIYTPLAAAWWSEGRGWATAEIGGSWNTSLQITRRDRFPPLLLFLAMDPKAELRDFLRQRCGNLKAAFAALDGSETGQLNRHDFETGLCRMGWHDCGNTFLDFDRDNTGTVNLRAFVNGLLGDDVVFGASSRPARHTYHPGMNTPRQLSEHLAPTLLQRIAPQPVVALPHSQPLTPKRCDKEHFARVTPLASSTSPKRSNGPAGAPLEERVRQLENQLAAEQARCNLEWRLTSQFREMIREEFQGLRRHLAEDAVPNQRVPIYSHLVEKFPRAKDADDEERHYVMVASVSERRLEAAPAAARHSGATAWVPAQSLRSSLGRSSTGGTYRMPQRYMNR
eukprot:g8633.t1